MPTMITSQANSAGCISCITKASQTLPDWVVELTKSSEKRSPSVKFHREGPVAVTSTQHDHCLLVSASIADANVLPSLTLQHHTAIAYNAIHDRLVEGGQWNPVRMWNWIPGIHAQMPGDVDRYMVFNAGRFSAYHDWYKKESEFESSVSTATAVGHDRSDLVIHVLATDRPGLPIENPRQEASYHYSERFGPMPPCFARATLPAKESVDLPDLLVGGTSSVCGEESLHQGDVEAQTRETLINMAQLIAVAYRNRNGNLASSTTSIPTVLDELVDELFRFESLRIFHARDEDLPLILEVVAPYVPQLKTQQVEAVRADICRPELLVEIEGTANLRD